MRSTLRIVGFGLLGLIAVALTGLGTLTWMRNSGTPVRVRSDEGGVSVAIPRGWFVDRVHPRDEKNQVFLTGRENGAFGFLQRGGFWIDRWPASNTTSIATMSSAWRDRQRRQQKSGWSLREESVAGHDAVVVRYTDTARGLQRLRLGDNHVTVRQFVARGYVWQIGTWLLPHAGGVAKQVERVAQSVELFAPRAWTTQIADGPRLTLPGGWVERDTPLPSGVFHAVAPGDPTRAWAYVFHYRHDTPAACVKAARKKIPSNGGTILREIPATLAGRDAIRLDFLFPDGKHSHADDVEWFVSDGRGGTYVLAVGHRSGDPRIAERLAAAWRFAA